MRKPYNFSKSVVGDSEEGVEDRRKALKFPSLTVTEDDDIACGRSTGSDDCSAIGSLALDRDSAARILSDGVIRFRGSNVEEDSCGSYAPSTVPTCCLPVGRT